MEGGAGGLIIRLGLGLGLVLQKNVLCFLVNKLV